MRGITVLLSAAVNSKHITISLSYRIGHNVSDWEDDGKIVGSLSGTLLEQV
jgi:hypothetical protein